MSRRPLPSLTALAVALVFTTASGGCGGDHPQSMVHPAGPGAEMIASLWWFLFGVLTAVFGVTMLLLAIAVFRRRSDERPGPPLGGTTFVVVSGMVIPAAILIVLLIASLRSTVGLRTPETNHTVHVIGHQFWWEVRYPEYDLVTANEIHIPVGEPVRLKLTSADVIHSLWVPNLTGKMDLMPGKTNTFWFRADEAGIFRGQCAEFCGAQHARMGLRVVAMEPEAFETWAAARQRPAPPPEEALAARGREVFFGEGGCAACHAIRGTPANATLGPDLTHIASRLTLGAATIPNTPENLAAWIDNPQAFKPGNLMPETQIEPDDLEALVAYLRRLE